MIHTTGQTKVAAPGEQECEAMLMQCIAGQTGF